MFPSSSSSSSRIAFPIYPKVERRKKDISSRFDSRIFRNLEKKKWRAKCGLDTYDISREHRGEQRTGYFVGPQNPSSSSFSLFLLLRAQTKRAKLVQDGTVVCLPLTSTLLDKDNAPSLIRFGDTLAPTYVERNVSLSALLCRGEKKNLADRSGQVRALFIPSYSQRKRLFHAKKWNQVL